ncbi:MAG: acyltransferase family protein [Dermatophilaceae bacterium]
MVHLTPKSSERVPRLPSLTGLRFFAALLVFGFHMTLSASPIPPNDPINLFADRDVAEFAERLFISAGYIGVSFFFVLSGFLLAWAARPGERMTTFWRRRIVKIFPNHLVMWALSMILFAAAITPVHAWFLNLFLVNSYSPDGSINVAVNPPSWTLCAELLFYLLFPLLFIAIRRIRARLLWRWAGLMVAGMVIIQVVNLTVIPDTPVSALTPVSSYQFWFGYLFPPVRLFEFLLGSIVARIVGEGHWPRVRTWHVIMACVVGYVVTYAAPFVWTFNVVMIVPLTMLIATVARNDALGRANFLQLPLMQWLGNISFGFYLCQGVVIFWTRQLMDNATFPTAVALVLVLGFFALTLLGGWALYAMVEDPMMRRFARARERVAPETSTTELRTVPTQAR